MSDNGTQGCGEWRTGSPTRPRAAAAPRPRRLRPRNSSPSRPRIRPARSPSRQTGRSAANEPRHFVCDVRCSFSQQPKRDSTRSLYLERAVPADRCTGWNICRPNFCHRPPASSGTPSSLASLTSRELEILRLVVRGLTNREIVETLVVGQTTVKTHVAHILTKLGLKYRAQAVVAAYECGFAVPGDTATSSDWHLRSLSAAHRARANNSRVCGARETRPPGPR